MPNRGMVRVSGLGCILLALALLVLPLKWLAAALFAAAFHEACHLAAIRLCGGEVRGVRIGGQGASIQIGELSRGKELICALAGPLGGLSLLLFARWMPRLAVCAAVHSLYNLLPIYPLDGGRALSCAAALILPPEQAKRVCSIMQTVCVLGLLALCIWASLWKHLGITPLVIGGLVLIRTDTVKIPCKPGRQRVQ